MIEAAAALPTADADPGRAPSASFTMRAPELPPGVLCVRMGPGANCSSAGSAIDVLFYGSVIVGALAVALAAALPPREPPPADEAEGSEAEGDD